MALFNVTLENTGHKFLNSDKESILHSGLVAGLNLKYGCDGGNCGECIAQLKKGSIQSIQYSDYVMDRQSKKQNYFLMCCHSASSDIELNAIEHGSENDIAEQNIDTKTYKINKLSEHVLEIAFKTPRSQPLRFFAGQYVTITLKNGLRRNKSLSSCPCDGIKPSIHVQQNKHSAEDGFSDYIFNSLKKNEVVNMVGPKGHFTLDDESNAPILLIAYETGMASIKSLIEHLLALEKDQPIELYHLHTPNCDHYLENYCHALEDALDNFQYSLVCLKDDDLTRLEEVYQHIVDEHEDITEFEVYAALPKPFHDKASDILKQAGLIEEQFKMDYLEHL